MKRSDFFKSLLGLAIAPIVIKEVVEAAPIPQDDDFYWENNKLIFTPQGKEKAIKAMEDLRPFVMKPNDPPMTQSEYDEAVKAMNKRISRKIDKWSAENLKRLTNL